MLFKEVNPYVQSDLDILYEILKERESGESISHKEMPNKFHHESFVKDKPYKVWYIVFNHNIPVGSCYISKTDEVGTAVFKEYRKQGLGSKILEYLLKLYPDVQFLANINPKNDKSIHMFEKAGFKHIQNTYLVLR